MLEEGLVGATELVPVRREASEVPRVVRMMEVVSPRRTEWGEGLGVIRVRIHCLYNPNHEPVFDALKLIMRKNEFQEYREVREWDGTIGYLK
jgi:hypothetical protein